MRSARRGGASLRYVTALRSQSVPSRMQTGCRGFTCRNLTLRESLSVSHIAEVH